MEPFGQVAHLKAGRELESPCRAILVREFLELPTNNDHILFKIDVIPRKAKTFALPHSLQ